MTGVDRYGPAPAGGRGGPAAAGEGIDTTSVVAEVVAETARLRESGALAAGFEEDLDRRFLEIAADPDALAREAAAGPSSRQRSSRPLAAGVLQLVPRAARRSKRTARSIAGSTRRAAGPRARAIERSSIEHAGRVAESVVTRGYVTADRYSRISSDHSSGRFGRRLARISPAGRARPPGGRTPVQTEEGGMAGPTVGDEPAAGSASADRSLEAWAIERLTRSPGGLIVHVECGDGTVLRQLTERGFESAGADPGGQASRGTAGVDKADKSVSLARAGAFEFLGSCSRASLGGLLLSGVTERLSPGRARALAHLAATRLRPGSAVVVLSAHPEDAGDVVSSDLSRVRPIHPVTWCHLFSRYGLAELTVNDPIGRDGHRYAVAARKPAARKRAGR